MSKHFVACLVGVLVSFCAAPLRGQPAAVSVQSATGSSAGLSPGSLGTIFGSGLSRKTSQVRPDDDHFPTEMEGVFVEINGKRAELLFVSDTQINFMVPPDLDVGPAVLVLQTGDGANLRADITLRLAAPGAFELGGSRQDRGAVLNAVTFQLEPFSVRTDENSGSDKRTRLAIFGSGIRFAGNPGRDSKKQNVADSVTVQLKSRGSGKTSKLEVEFAGPAPGLPGVDQLNIVVPEGSDTSGIFEITIIVGGMSSNTITIEFNSTASGNASLAAVSVPPSVTGGTTAAGTVGLTGPAPNGGAQVFLYSSSDDLEVPPSITVPAGQTSASFSIKAHVVSNAETVKVGASFNGVVLAAMVSITPLPCVASESLSSGAVVGGNNLTGTITLSAPAPAGGMVVNLKSNNSLVQVPASATVPGGQTSVTFPVTTSATPASAPATITATLGGCAPSRVNVTVDPADCVGAISLSVGSVAGGIGLTGTVTLAAPAPRGGVVVSLQSNNPASQPDAFVTVPAGQTAANFHIATKPVSANTNTTITASIGGCTPVSVVLVVTTQICVASVSLSARSVEGGSSVGGTVTLNAPAPGGGVWVRLVSSADPTVQVPGGITVPGGQTSATFRVTTGQTTKNVDATITATADGCGATATLTVNPEN